jgi:hypothetical protein
MRLSVVGRTSGGLRPVPPWNRLIQRSAGLIHPAVVKRRTEDVGADAPCLMAPTESPQVRVLRAGTHKKPTDNTALPGTRRHRC